MSSISDELKTHPKGYGGYVPQIMTEITVDTIIGATRDVPSPEEKPYWSGKEHIQGYKGYVPKRIIRRDPSPQKPPSRPSSSETDSKAAPIFARLQTATPDAHAGRPEWLTSSAPPREATPLTAAEDRPPVQLLHSHDIIAHDSANTVPLSTTTVKPLVGYTGYVPRRVNADLAGKSMWRALEEHGAAPTASANSAPLQPGEGSRPSSADAPSKPAPIAAIPGYSGHVPQRLRTLDGRFQVATGGIPPAPTGDLQNHSDPSTDYTRDLHVSGYTGYVPRDWATATGKSRWSAVSHGYREPTPNDVLHQRSVYASTA